MESTNNLEEIVRMTQQFGLAIVISPAFLSISLSALWVAVRRAGTSTSSPQQKLGTALKSFPYTVVCTLLVAAGPETLLWFIDIDANAPPWPAILNISLTVSIIAMFASAFRCAWLLDACARAANAESSPDQGKPDTTDEKSKGGKLAAFRRRQRAKQRELIVLPGARRAITCEHARTVSAGVVLAVLLVPLGGFNVFWTLLGCAAVAATFYGLGKFFFPTRSETPFGTVDEIDQMSDQELQDTLDQFLAVRPRYIKRLVNLLRRQYAVDPPEWAARVMAAAHAESGATVHRLQPTLDAVSANSVRARHDAVLARWAKYELDVGALIDYPSMSDVRVPETAAMVRAMRAAADAREAEDAAQYRRAVTDFEIAFDAAEHEARKRAQSTLSERDRKWLREARRLLALAEDNAATEPERQLAFRRLRRVLDGLIVVPPAAVAELERRVMPQLVSGAREEE